MLGHAGKESTRRKSKDTERKKKASASLSL